MREARIVVASAVFLAFTPPLAAQSVPPLQRGTRVRVVIPTDSARPEWVVAGTLVRLSGDTVVVASGLRQPEALVLASGRRLEVLSGWGSSRTNQGAAAGALIGGLGGAFLASATYQPCEPAGMFSCLYDVGSGATVAGGFLLGGLLGGALGALVGSGIRQEVWTPVSTVGVQVGVLLSSRAADRRVQPTAPR